MLNPGLPINPAATSFGARNAILTGTSRRYIVPDFSGSLSVKATLQGISTWKVNGRDFRVSESAFLVVNCGQPFTIAYDGPDEVTTFCLLFQTGFVERLATAKIFRQQDLWRIHFELIPPSSGLRFDLDQTMS